jgi:hypothetical protein
MQNPTNNKMTPDPSASRFVRDIVNDRHDGKETLSCEDTTSRLPEGSGEMFSPRPSHGELVVPKQFDVLCGRKKEAYKHLGNRTFRAIIFMHCSGYQTTKSRKEKKHITGEIIAFIHKCGGRFLRKDAQMNMWYRVSDADAHEKVSHALRSSKDSKSRRSYRHLKL